MLRSTLLMLFALLLLNAPAHAQQIEMPYRTDRGLTVAEYYLSTNKYSAALDVLADVLKRHPNNADAYTYQGYAYMKLSDAAKASENFKLALKIAPQHLGANMYQGILFAEAGDLQRALEQLQVIRLTCQKMDCEEMRTLESAIDRVKKTVTTAPAVKE